ncbi:ABC transporter ATP-binding protein [Umezawaea sp. Da 62-37]|uniref:ABC transporter ATP-binding protein n=1 Tax=Umezawaea sp. Da 62-37 TaxID=3075927 RepID=UPI0028F71D10|nr:ABC transporter ATP-binding protein [Umezawaea sp. Da 62-37]WNV86152.1 ABC transporter ATP-binding protein [Umezawaea sp. Da 62-37]
MNPTVLDVQGLAKTYDGHGRSVEAVRDLTFRIARGELVCIVGPSGAGKTTLLRCVAGLLDASGGTIHLDGAPVTGPPAGMAVVFQEYGRSLFPWLTVRRNVELPLKEKGLDRATRTAKVDAALDAVGLRDSADAHPWQLSGGMQQRVAIARAVAYEPSVLLMDEPFASVDAQTRTELEDLVRELWRELGVTVLFVTHDIDEAVYLGQRVLVLSNRPTVVLEDVHVHLPDVRDQLDTRSSPAFTEARNRVYELVQRAKRGYRPDTAADVPGTPIRVPASGT